MQLTNDELILVLIGMVREVNPKMLQQGPEGFTLDFASLDAKEELTDDETLLLKIRAAMEGAEVGTPRSIELAAPEGQRMADALVSLEKLGDWPPDVTSLNKDLQQKLRSVE